MTVWPYRFAGVAAISFPLWLGSTPALAAEGSISSVEVASEEVRVVFEATDTASAVDPSSVSVSIDGTEVPATAQPLTDAAASIQRTTMLVMDTSGSMNENGRLGAAKQAARAFVSTVPEDVRVGLVTFDDGAEVVQRPTTDRAALVEAVEALEADGSTAIFDGVVLAARQLGREGTRSIVLLTDGEEEGSRSTLAAATRNLRGKDLRLDAVAFQTSAGRGTLERLADAGGGSVLTSASSTELTAQFEAAAKRISRQLLVTAELPPDAPTGQVTLVVAGQAGADTVTDTAIALLAAAPSPSPTVDAAPRPVEIAQSPLLREELIWVATALFFLGLLGIMAFAFNAAVPGRGSLVSRQLSVYTLQRGKQAESRRESTAFGESSVAQSAVDLAGRITAGGGFEEALQRRLDAGAVPLKPAEFILVQASALLLVPTFAFFLTGGNVVLTLVALVLAAAGPYLFLSLKQARRRTKFSNGLPDVLQLMAGSLSAGYSLPQSVDTVVREGDDPIATEFNRALIETRLGVPIEDALETIAERMKSQDWAWVVMAIRVQREVGGNLAELLVTVAATLRDRARIRRQIQTLSAEGRLSAWILGALPVVFALYLLVARPSYILMLTREPLGWIMIGSGLVTMTVGALWMKKIVNVEV